MPWVVMMALCAVTTAQQRRAGDSRREGNLKIGDPAPDFDLKRLHEKGRVTLSSFKGKRPVVLIFGSYT